MKRIIFFMAIPILGSCMGPRNISNSGKVTPKGNFVIGGNMSVNLPSQTVNSLRDVTKGFVNELTNKDSIYINPDFEKINKAAVAYSLDPISVGNEFYLRYGLFKKVDIGIKLAGNAKAFDFQYQFLGPLGNINDITNESFYGSVGLQYSTQQQELPSILADIQERLNYTFKRQDFLVPLIFSYSFGNEESIGAFAWGLVIDYSKISYASAPAGIYNYDFAKLIGNEEKQDYFSYGFFMNCKIGYKYVFLVPAIAMYYQNYGDYKMISGNTFGFKGLTIIPSIGLKIRLGKSSIL